jgi:hypothetical protein
MGVEEDGIFSAPLNCRWNRSRLSEIRGKDGKLLSHKIVKGVIVVRKSGFGDEVRGAQEVKGASGGEGGGRDNSANPAVEQGMMSGRHVVIEGLCGPVAYVCGRHTPVWAAHGYCRTAQRRFPRPPRHLQYHSCHTWPFHSPLPLSQHAPEPD